MIPTSALPILFTPYLRPYDENSPVDVVHRSNTIVPLEQWEQGLYLRVSYSR
jgi:hypothetical protein